MDYNWYWAIDQVVLIGIVNLAIVTIVVDRFDVIVIVGIDFGLNEIVGTIVVVWLDLFHG